MKYWHLSKSTTWWPKLAHCAPSPPCGWPLKNLGFVAINPSWPLFHSFFWWLPEVVSFAISANSATWWFVINASGATWWPKFANNAMQWMRYHIWWKHCQRHNGPRNWLCDLELIANLGTSWTQASVTTLWPNAPGNVYRFLDFWDN